MNCTSVEIIMACETYSDISVGRFEIPEGHEEAMAEALTDFLEGYISKIEAQEAIE